MDRAAALLNDTNLQIYTYAAQIPYLNIAIDELQESMETNNVSITNAVDVTIDVTAGVVVIDFSTTPALPSDLIAIRKVWERDTGSTEDWSMMTQVEFLPPYVEQTQMLMYWAWLNQQLTFIGATSDRNLRIDYIASRMTAITDDTDVIDLINAETFLSYRTAALCAEYIGQNDTRAATLNGNAAIGLDRFLIINTKAKQSITTRRRPFMAAYKVRGGF